LVLVDLLVKIHQQMAVMVQIQFFQQSRLLVAVVVGTLATTVMDLAVLVVVLVIRHHLLERVVLVQLAKDIRVETPQLTQVPMELVVVVEVLEVLVKIHHLTQLVVLVELESLLP
jgi:hypothetical protein